MINFNIGVFLVECVCLFRDIFYFCEGVYFLFIFMFFVMYMGWVGDNMVVEVFFNCDYGYNI